MRLATAIAWRPPLPLSPTAANTTSVGVSVQACCCNVMSGAWPGTKSSRSRIGHTRSTRVLADTAAPATPRPAARNWRRLRNIDAIVAPRDAGDMAVVETMTFRLVEGADVDAFLA